MTSSLDRVMCLQIEMELNSGSIVIVEIRLFHLEERGEEKD